MVVSIECVIPILRVESLKKSLRYYVETLGFTIDWGGSEGGGMASVSRDDRAIMLCEGDQGNPGTWVWIGVSDIEPLYEHVRFKGVKVLEPPTNYPWAYEMKIEDPDGHVLRFGSDPRE